MTGRAESIKPLSKGAAILFFLLLGTWLGVGGAYTLLTASWFPAFPVQVDAFYALLVGIAGQPLGSYFFGIITITLSLASLWGAFRAYRHVRV